VRAELALGAGAELDVAVGVAVVVSGVAVGVAVVLSGVGPGVEVVLSGVGPTVAVMAAGCAGVREPDVAVVADAHAAVVPPGDAWLRAS
jgi:hypothetical protein